MVNPHPSYRFQKPSERSKGLDHNPGPWYRISNRPPIEKDCRLCDNPIEKEALFYYKLLSGTPDWKNAVVHWICLLTTEQFYPEIDRIDNP